MGLKMHWVTGWAPMPEASLEPVDGVGLGVEHIHSDVGVWLFILAPVCYMLDVVMRGWMVVIGYAQTTKS